MAESPAMTGAASSAPVPKARWTRVGLLLFLIYLICYADRSNISVAVPDMVEQLRLSSTVAGVLLSAFFWGYVITQIPGGWAANRFSPKKVIVGSLVVVGITACATGLTSDYTSLLAIRFTMGLAEGTVFPSFAVMFLRWFPSIERGRAVSFTQYALPVSSALMAPLAGWMIHVWDYRTMFVLQGLPAFFLALAFWVLVADDPADDRRLDPRERELILRERDEETTSESTFLTSLRRPVLWALCLTYFLWITGMYAFGLWLPSVISQFSAAGIDAVGWLTALPYAVAALALYLLSRASDRSSHSRGWFVAGAMTIGGVALLVQYVVGDTVWTNMALLILTAVGIYGALGAWWTWALSKVPRNQAGASIGLINLCGNFGGIVGPILVGAVSAPDEGPGGGFYVLGFVLLAAAVLAAVIAVRSDGPAARARLVGAAEHPTSPR
ncbi:sugar phosphate permease [Actinoalloteichus hoggarensis]|uniref:Putative tartrate transporter n=1 Tax=Actinoalloteichus hoggarensis TaxID=1470176 RepID=A0A221W7G7_9PSEU|nr:MFS transporter [Actinoalloteichus hoggarensis]ASO21694.1 Putative tartrate transporter [Actinoalloteichus hoggarensis]MBB5922289.1 sugar phosphate permease [Actinoalloteichus hoggarensis]